MKQRHEARILALQYLYSHEFRSLNGLEEENELPCLSEEEIAAYDVEIPTFARYLYAGTLEHLESIDALISTYSKRRPIERIGIITKNILRLSIFSLLYMKEVHPSIVIDEAVKLSLEFTDDVTYKYINGILDAVKKQER